jgi:dTDP-4-dehydrorhamnose 3,5-epimerase
MKLVRTELPGVVIVEPMLLPDERGWFMESFNEERFHAALEAFDLPRPRPFVQDNHSCSAAGVLRGLHCQVAPHAQGKLVRVVKGVAFDVAVDVRPDSPCFGAWAGVDLDARLHRQLWIPEGFAHAFLALEDDTQVLYKTTDYYARDCERSILWSDPRIGIAWPSHPRRGMPQVAAKDAAAPMLHDIFGR